jgi:hypothetical protein
MVLAGCGGGDRHAFTSTDSWYSPPPSVAGFTAVDKNNFAPVIESLQPEAQEALAASPARRVTAEQAERLAGRQLPQGAEYVLLRAVALYEGTGAFVVGVQGASVHVHHGCLGRSPAPMTRKALVAVLPAVPGVVYVSCSMAE